MKHGGGEERSASEESGVSTASHIRVRVRTQEPLPPAQFLLPVARDETLAQLRARIHGVLLQHYAGDAQWDPAALALEVDGFRLWEDQVATVLRDGETLTVLCSDEGPPRKRTRQQEPDDVMLEANRIVQNMRAEVGPRGERKMSLRMQGEPSFPMPPPGMPGLAGGVAEALSAFESRKRQRQNEAEDGAEKNNADGTERIAHGTDSDSEVIQGVQVSADPATGDNAKAKASYTVTTGGAASDTSSSETESTESSDSDVSSSSDDDSSSNESSSDTSTESDSTESDSTESDDSDSDQDTQATRSSDGEHNAQQPSTEETTSSATDTSTTSSDNTSESSQSDEESSDSDASSDTDADDSDSDSSSSSASTESSAPSTAPTTAEPTPWVPPGQGKASTKRKNLRRREQRRQ